VRTEFDSDRTAHFLLDILFRIRDKQAACACWRGVGEAAGESWESIENEICSGIKLVSSLQKRKLLRKIL